MHLTRYVHTSKREHPPAIVLISAAAINGALRPRLPYMLHAHDCSYEQHVNLRATAAAKLALLRVSANLLAWEDRCLFQSAHNKERARMTETKVEPTSKLSGGKKAALWAVGILGTAVAGFASERVQDQLCLKMPSLASMEYSPESANSIKYSSLESKATQDTLSGKPVVFRAVYLGETEQEAYSGFIVEDQLKGKVVLNTRGVGFTESSSGPFGTTASELPRFGVLVTREVAEKLKDVKKGSMVEFDGFGYSVKPGSKLSKNPTFPMVPGFASFIVQATKADIVRPTNYPADRLLCRLLHRKELASY